MPENLGQSGDAALPTPIDRLLLALRHPLRRKILITLAQENGSAGSISSALEEDLSNVSYHLNKVLAKQCEVLHLVDTVQNRGAHEKIYRLKEESFAGILDWPEIPEPLRGGLRGISLRGFLAILIGAIETGALDSLLGSDLQWYPAQVDGRGWLKISKAAQQFHETVKGAVGDTCRRSRAGRDSNKLHNVIVGVAAFQAPSPAASGGDLGS